MSQNDSQDNAHVSFHESVNFLYWLVSTHAMCLLPFLRTSFGSEGLGFTALFALLLQLIAIAVSGDLAMAYFLVLWLMALVVQRFITFQNWFQRRRVHSYYGGYPWAARLLNPFVSDERKLLMTEPMTCVLLAVPLCALGSGFLVGFVLLGVISLGVKNGMELEVRRRRIQQLEDADIEHESLLDDWESHRNRWT